MQSHGKTFLYGLVGTVQGRLGWAHAEFNKLCPEIETIIQEANWLKAAPFDTIHYILRFGATAESTIHCRNIKKYQELEVASQLSMRDLHEVLLSRPDIRLLLCRELERVFSWLQQKYSLPEMPRLYSYLRRAATPNTSFERTREG